MKILGIHDGHNASAALVVDGELKYAASEERYSRLKHHYGFPKNAINKILSITKLEIDDIDAIAISIGPGSFTGLRIGLGFSKGIAYAKNLPIIPVPSMLSLAYSLREYEPKQGILHSHANKVFFQTFRWENNIPLPNKEPSVGEIDDYFQVLSHGFYYNCEDLLPNLKQLWLAKPSSSNIGQLASIHFEDLVVNEPYSLVPSYIAPFKTGT